MEESINYQFKNIGPIKDAQLELGNLTVIAGANNTGKTYLAYTLYGFLDYVSKLWVHQDVLEDEEAFRRHFFRPPRFSERRFSSRRFEEDKKLKMSINATKKGVEVFMPVSNVQHRVNSLCHRFSYHMGDVFSVSDDVFKDPALRCRLPSAIFDSKNSGMSEKSLLGMKLVDDTLHIRINTRIPERLSPVIETIVERISLARCFPPAFVLSAERFGISLFYKELDFAKNRIVEVLQKFKDERHKDQRMDLLISSSTARYAKPIKDNIDFTRSLHEVQKKTGVLKGHKFFDKVKDMMRGYYRYENNEIYFISKQRKEKAFRIPLHLASSSARGMSDLYFYLRHVAYRGQLLIIDEPESHLDTKNQILMARLLARCVNAGVRVLITTHSDYIIKEFNNLVMLSNDFPRKEEFLKKHKRQYMEDDFLKKEAVRAYICEKGRLTKCDVDNRGMIMPSFDDTINDINRVSNTLSSYLPEGE